MYSCSEKGWDIFMLWRVKAYRRYILYLGLFLVSQLLLTVMYGLWFQVESARIWVVTVMIIAGLFLFFSVLYLLQWNLRRLELETRLEEYDKQRQTELDFDVMLQRHIGDMQKLCGQYLGQINEVYRLLETRGNDTEQKLAAEEILHELEDTINVNRMIKYCSCEEINAVLTFKAELCHRRGIRFRTEFGLSGEKTVDVLDLCSLVDYLLDAGMSIYKRFPQKEMAFILKADEISQRQVLKLELKLDAGFNGEKKVSEKKLQSKLWCRELDLIKRICERKKGYMDIRRRDTGAELVVIL